MEPTAYKQKWHKLRESKVDLDALHHLSRQIAFSFTDRYFQRGLYEPAYIDLLCEMATSYLTPEQNNVASAALFGLVVEKLCDDFEELPVELYCRVMCQVISFCRTTAAGVRLDEALIGFNITSFDHLHQRAVTTHTTQYSYDINKAPARIILLSRVTIGADVAILSVMIQRLRKLFPETEIVIVGHGKLRGLFESTPNVRLRELTYARRGGLFERFASWHATLEILKDEMPTGGEEAVLVIDPDSRISQLGVLPLVHGENYLFFNTRDHSSATAGRCMAELANDWMDKVFGISDFCYPTVWIPDSVTQAAQARMDLLRASGARQVLTVNLGVGQNPRKRLSLEFEKRLLLALAAVPETVVILDKGFGPDEAERTASLTRHAKSCGLPCLQTHFPNTNFPSLSHGIVTVECGITEMAALIAHSDEYIGYDSACQHIAAATKTPTLTVFAGSNNMNFVRRWSACGDTECRIVHVNTLSDPRHVDVDEIISRLMQERAHCSLKHPRQRIHEIRKEQRRNPAKRPTTKE